MSALASFVSNTFEEGAQSMPYPSALNQLSCSWYYLLLQAITASGTRKNELIISELQSQIKNKNVTFDVKATSDSTVSCDHSSYASVIHLKSFFWPPYDSITCQSFCTCLKEILSIHMPHAYPWNCLFY